MATKITQYLEIILEGNDLTYEQAKALQDTIFEGDVSEVQIAAFLAAMRMKRATAQEIAGLARSLRDHAVRVEADVDDLIDTCGTGGATIKTFNISTAAALVAAGAGAHVAKHGNRGITSQCGSADVLAELGVKIDAGPDTVAECIKQAHIGFMFAPRYHPAMKFVQPIRKSLDFRTAFNILGPLANPAGATAQVMGVASEALMDRIIEALKILGVRRAMVIHGQGMDEISTVGQTKICRLIGEQITVMELDPADLGFSAGSIDELKTGDSTTNAQIIRDILEGRETGPRKDIVVLNAAAAIIVANLADDFEPAIETANESIREGKALSCLEKLIEVSNKT
ncbi:MAG: anthranilate phosphoribosyltransferase [Planctomycetota bacterium]|jgi:anthranilate phosphoribosyltransferase